jgi:hypothetical protein
VIVGISCAVVVLAALFVAVAKRNDDLYRIGRRTYLGRIWRLHVCGEKACVNHDFGYHRRDAVIATRVMCGTNRLPQGSYLAWQWELSKHGLVLWRGKTHRISNRRNR